MSAPTEAARTFIIAIEDIEINHERQRRGLGDDSRKAKVAFEELCDSIRRVGMLNNIVVTQAYELVAGYRRLQAAKTLGWTHVEAKFIEDLDEIDRREAELEENIARLDLSWHEREDAIAELHRLRTERDPNWGQRQTAQAIGKEQSKVSIALKMSKMMEVMPELRKAKSLNQALSWANQKAKNILRVEEVKASPEAYADIESRIILGDSTEVIRSLPSESFHAVITDPPFGIGYDVREAGANSVSSYSDTEEAYLRLLGMAPELYRVIKPDGWLVWFLGITWYERAKLAFRGAGFVVDEIPIVWDRSDGRNYTVRPDRYFGRGYDIALHCIKGNPEIIQRGKSNVLRIPPLRQDDKELLVERPVELYQELIRRLTVPGEVVADFFVGSGSCPAAAASLGREYFGVERDPERRAKAITKIKAHTPNG